MKYIIVLGDGMADEPLEVLGNKTPLHLKSSEDYRNITVSLAYTVTVYDGCSVRTESHLSAGRIIVIRTALFRNGIMRHHRVYITACNKEAKSRSAESLKVLGTLIVGLGEDSNSKALRLQDTRDYCNAKGGMINICITRNVYKVYL